MSVFASLMRVGSTLNAVQLETELETKLPAAFTARASAGLVNTTGAYATLSTLTDTISVEADEVCLFASFINYSGSVITDGIGFRHLVNAVASVPVIEVVSPISSTSGNISVVTFFSVWENLSGSIPFVTQWRRTAGSGTVYSSNAYHTILRFKKR